MEEGWVPGTPGKLNLGRAEPICKLSGSGGEVVLEDGDGGFVPGICEENDERKFEGSGLSLKTGMMIHDPLASWGDFGFVDLLARAEVGRTEPLMDFSSDSVRCRSSSFFVPGNGEVVAIDVNKWANSGEMAQGVDEAASEQSSKSATGLDEMLLQSQDSSVSYAPMVAGSSSPVQGDFTSIDLNATPHQKPKRRKHRPKVVIEVKAKRPKKQAATTVTSNSDGTKAKRKYIKKNSSGDTEKQTGKRKYVRKKGVSDPSSTPPAEAGQTGRRKYERKKGVTYPSSAPPAEAGQTGKRKYVRRKGVCDPLANSQTDAVETVEQEGSEPASKSCRKVLTFDSDCQVDDASLFPERDPALQEQHVWSKNQQCSTTKVDAASITDTSFPIHDAETLTDNSRWKPWSEDQDIGTKLNLGDQAKNSTVSVSEHNTTQGCTDVRCSLSSAITIARNEGNLAREWWHCDPNALIMALNSSSWNSTSKDDGFTATKAAQDVSGDGTSLQAFPVNETSGFSRMQEAREMVGGKSCTERLVTKEQARLARRNRMQKRKSANNVQNQSAMVEQHYHTSRSGPIAFTPNAIWDYLLDVEGVTEKLKDLNINRKTRKTHLKCTALVSLDPWYQAKHAHISLKRKGEEQNELVVYRNNDTVVHFDGSQIKKRQPRAKVDLDDETSRVWTLLLENINNPGVDGTDEEKAKWWENERKVFSGRANSFISRMHLVQGDRRFSKWKGSVVDSVIGVFLTQNVSDHLSSSAFISLAARFPLKPKCNDRSQNNNHTCSPNANLETDVTDKEELVAWGSTNKRRTRSSTADNVPVHQDQINAAASNEDICNRGGRNSSDDSNCYLDAFGSERKMFVKLMENQLISKTVETKNIMNDHQSVLEEGVSSQSSATTFQSSPESSPSRAVDRTSLCSVINSEFGPADVSIPKTYGYSRSFVELLQMAGNPEYQEAGFFRYCTGIDENFNSVQNIPEEVRLDDQQGYDVDSNHTSSSEEIGTSSSDVRVMELSFEPTEVESGRTPGMIITSNEISEKGDECERSQQDCLSSVPQISTTTSNSEPSDLREKSEMCHRYSEQQSETGGCKTGTCAIRNTNEVISMDPDQNDIGKRGLRMLSTITPLMTDLNDSIGASNSQKVSELQAINSVPEKATYASDRAFYESNIESLKAKRRRVGKDINHNFDWEGLRKQTQVNGKSRVKTPETMDSLDYEALRSADVSEIAYTIRDRGMNNVLAGRIKDFLNRLVNEHGSIDLEWLRDVPPDQAKEYLLSVRGLGLKSVECVRLLTLHHLAFPVDTNVGRIAVRLGWVPLQPLPESLQLHLLEMYPVQESIQKYLWPRLCKLDQKTLYELHYQMITFGKVFCTKSKPNCNACPMRGECRHFASAFASARLALPGPEERSMVPTNEYRSNQNSYPPSEGTSYHLQLQSPNVCQHEVTQENRLIGDSSEHLSKAVRCEPIIEEPNSPEPECVQAGASDIEDGVYEETDEIPEIKLNMEEFAQSLQNYMHGNLDLQEGDVSRALVALTPEAASIPMPKLKNVSKLRTEHHVYELPDLHPLLEGLDRREPDDPCSYLLAIWTPGETATSIQPPEACSSSESGKLCDQETCFSCNSSREANSQTVRGTLLIPCRTAMRGSFPLNGTYFQVNEVFADHHSSLNPISMPRKWLWNLPRRTVYFGTSIPTIFKGLSTEGIQQCFWRGYVCVRGFDQIHRAPRPLLARLHFPASKLTRTRGKPNAE